jgi:hypothetical protein
VLDADSDPAVRSTGRKTLGWTPADVAERVRHQGVRETLLGLLRVEGHSDDGKGTCTKLQDECGWTDTLYTVKEHEELCVPEATAGRNFFKYESSYDFGQGMDS